MGGGAPTPPISPPGSSYMKCSPPLPGKIQSKEEVKKGGKNSVKDWAGEEGMRSQPGGEGDRGEGHPSR